MRIAFFIPVISIILLASCNSNSELVFIGAGESKIVDRHGRCLLIEDLSKPKAHEGYALSTVKAIWLVLEEGERNTGDGSRPMRMSECP